MGLAFTRLSKLCLICAAISLRLKAEACATWGEARGPVAGVAAAAAAPPAPGTGTAPYGLTEAGLQGERA